MEKIPSLRDFLSIVFKYKIGILLLFTIIVSTVTTLTYVWPFMYEASSKILVKFDRSNISLSGSMPSTQSTLTMRGTEEEILSEIEIFYNRYLIEKLVNQLWSDLTSVGIFTPQTLWQKIKFFFKEIFSWLRDTVYRIGYYLNLIIKLPPFEEQISRIQSNLKIETIKDSNIIQVKYRSWNPHLAAKIVNTLTELYLEHHISVHKIPHAHNFFQTQKDILKKKLRSQEERLKEFRQKWDLASITIEKKLILENLSALMLENKNLKSKLHEKQREFYHTRIRVIDEKEVELHRMERELSLVEESYRRYVGRLEDSRISEALDLAQISNVSVIEPAYVPFSPTRRISFLPRRVLHILAGTIVGLIVGIGYAFLARQLDHTFQDREDVEQLLKFPCFASIPYE